MQTSLSIRYKYRIRFVRVLYTIVKTINAYYIVARRTHISNIEQVQGGFNATDRYEL